MEELKHTDKLYTDIINTYLDIASVRLTATKFKTTRVKVRRVLITEELWSSKTSLEVKHLQESGMTTKQIATKLSTTIKAVQQYLPYTRGIYGADNP